MQFGIEVQDGFGSLYCTNEVNDVYMRMTVISFPSQMFSFFCFTAHIHCTTQTHLQIKNSLSTHPCEGAHTRTQTDTTTYISVTLQHSI